MEEDERLRNSMIKEITILREMLATLLQEESFLLNNDTSSWKHLMPVRHAMIEAWHHAALHRDQIHKNWDADGKESVACEVEILLAQVVALTAKVQEQSTRNRLLEERVDKTFEKKSKLILMEEPVCEQE